MFSRIPCGVAVRQRFRLMPYCVMASLLALTSASRATQTVPQERISAVWREMAAADRRIEKCAATWKRDTRVAPNPKSDPEKAAALTIEQSKAQGLSPKDQESNADTIRKFAERLRAGSRDTAVLSFITDMRTIRCEVDDTAPGLSSPAHFLDYSAGQYNVSVQSAAEVSPNGVVGRKPDETLPHSAPDSGMLQLLAGWPVTGYFSPSDSRLGIDPDGRIRIEKEESVQGMSRLVRIWLDSHTLRPVELEHSIAQNGQVLDRYRVLKIQQNAGIPFPSKIRMENRNLQGKLLVSTDYSLKKLAMNAAVPKSELARSGLRQGTLIYDKRFDAGVRYRLAHDRIPGDDAVKRLIEDEQRGERGVTEGSLFWPWIRLAVAVCLLIAYLGFRRRKAQSA